MKKISQILENIEQNPSFAQTNNGLGITNRYTPIQNIITNLKNYYGATYNIVVEQYEGNTIKMRCSRWINTCEASNDLSNIVVGGKNILNYVYEQGLNGVKMVMELGKIAVYLYPLDVNSPEVNQLEKTPDASEYSDIHANEHRTSQIQDLIYTDVHVNEDCEIVLVNKINNILEGKDDDEEMEDQTLKELREIITSDNKVKAAEQFANLITQQMSLPIDYYFKAVKDKDGNESIALRHKTTKRRPFGKKADVVTSVLNIYGEGDEAIWVDGYDNPEALPEDLKVLIENILKFIQAEKTGDPCVYALRDGESTEENPDDNEDDNTDGDDKTEETDDTSEKEDKKEEDK